VKAQVRRGTTRAEVERVKSKLDAARVAFTQSERVDADEESTAVMQRMTRAEEAVRDMEKELAIAIRKDEAALADLANANLQVLIATDDEVVAAFKAPALKMERLLSGELKLVADELGAALMAVKDQSGGDPGVGSSLKDFLLWFPVYRDRACAALIPSGRTYSQVLEDKKKTFSQWADGTAYAMSRRRKG
jgi:hypothetical protein